MERIQQIYLRWHSPLDTKVNQYLTALATILNGEFTNSGDILCTREDLSTMRSESIGSTSASFVDTLLTLQTLKSTFAGIVTSDGDYGIANNAWTASADLSRTSERC